MKKLSYFCTLLWAMGCLGCAAPRPIAQLSYQEPGANWYMGKQLAEKSQGGITVVAIFERDRGQRLAFDIEIINQSDSQYLVMPAQCYLVAGDAGPDAKPADRLYAINPEHTLLEVDKSLSRQDAASANNAAQGVFTALLNIASDAATINEDVSDEEEAAADADREDTWRRIEDRDMEIDQEIHSLNDMRERLSVDLLRRTTLLPNTSYFGKVFFPLKKTARSLTLVVPIGPHRFAFAYDQRLIYP